MSVTKSHGGIPVNYNYHINKLQTFTNQKRTTKDNRIKIINKLITK